MRRAMTMVPFRPRRERVDAKKVMRLVLTASKGWKPQNVYHVMDITDRIAEALDE